MTNNIANPNAKESKAHVFTYGSLMFEPVWRRVVQGNYVSGMAKLDGFQRFRVKEATYPAVVRRPGSELSGRVYFDVSSSDLERLDAFEGSEYERVEVSALVDDDARRGQGVSCGIYLFTDLANLIDKPWDEQWFAQVGIHEFMRTYCVEKGV